MRERRVHLLFAALGVAAYLLNATALAWSMIRCQEPDGRIVLEPVGDHSCCPESEPASHDDPEPAADMLVCDAFSPCACDDSPVGVELLTTREQDAPLECPRLAPVHFALPPVQSARSGEPRCRPFVRGSPGESTRRCLRSVVLLI